MLKLRVTNDIDNIVIAEIEASTDVDLIQLCLNHVNHDHNVKFEYDPMIMLLTREVNKRFDFNMIQASTHRNVLIYVMCLIQSYHLGSTMTLTDDDTLTCTFERFDAI